MAAWPSGKAEACKAFTPSSNLGVASKFFFNFRLDFVAKKVRALPKLRKEFHHLHDGSFAVCLALDFYLVAKHAHNLDTASMLERGCGRFIVC